MLNSGEESSENTVLWLMRKDGGSCFTLEVSSEEPLLIDVSRNVTPSHNSECPSKGKSGKPTLNWKKYDGNDPK